MPKSFLVPIQMNQNEIYQPVLQLLSSDPSGTGGQHYTNSNAAGAFIPKFHNDTVWKTLAFTDSAPASHAYDSHSGTVPLADLAEYAKGSVIIGGDTEWEDLPVGTQTYVLTVGASDVVSWQPPGSPGIHDLLGSSHDSTDRDPTQGDIIQANGSDQWTHLAIGNANDLLQVSGGSAAWVSIADIMADLTDGNGIADFTYDGSSAASIVLGTPSSITEISTNSVGALTHSHELDANIDLSYFDNDLAALTAGTGISSAGTYNGSTARTFAFDAGGLGVTTMVTGDWIVFDDAGTSSKALISAIPLSIFNNDSNWSATTGVVESIGNTTGVTIGGTAAIPTVTVQLDQFAEKTGDLVGTDRLAGVTGTTNWTETISDIPLSIFDNDSAWISSVANLDDIGDVDAYSSPANGELLEYNSSSWRHRTLAELDIATVTYVDNLVAGGVLYKGGYVVSTDTPALETTPGPLNIKTGWMYTVTGADGDFFGQTLEAGDVLIAEQDDPTTLAHWTIVSAEIADSFIALQDVDEADYTGHAGQVVRVNSTPDGLEFVALSSLMADLTDGNGITDFTYDGSSTATISIDLLTDPGLTVATGGLALGTPTSISEASTNAVSGSGHTHALDSAIDLSYFDNDLAFLTTGDGLTSGGTYNGATARTITLGTPGQITEISTDAVSASSHTHSLDSAIDLSYFDNDLALLSQGTNGGIATMSYNGAAAETVELDLNNLANVVTMEGEDLIAIYDDSVGGTRDVTFTTMLSYIGSIGNYTKKVSLDCIAATTTPVDITTLGTRDVVVQVYRTTTPWDEVEVDCKRTSTTEVNVTFATAPSAGEFRIVVTG